MPNDMLPNKPSTAVAPRQEKAIVTDSGLFHNLMDTSRFEHLQRVAKVFANSALVPEHFRGKEADCFIAVEMAMRLQLHPFNLMQSLYVVHGKPGIEAKMAIALINSSGLFDGPLQFKLAGEGMKRQCTAFAVHSKTKQVCETTVTMDMAKAEGWIDKSGSKWKTLPDLMLQYRSASFFARLYCPEVIFGMQTREELDEIDVTPPAQDRAEVPARATLREKLGIVDVAVTATEAANYSAQEKVPEPRQSPKAPPPTASVADLVDSGHIVVHDEPAQGAQGSLGVATPQPAAENAGKAPSATAPMPFDNVLSHAKRAKTQEQVDIVRDVLRDPAYTAEQRAEAENILGSKKLAEA